MYLSITVRPTLRPAQNMTQINMSDRFTLTYANRNSESEGIFANKLGPDLKKIQISQAT